MKLNETLKWVGTPFLLYLIVSNVKYKYLIFKKCLSTVEKDTETENEKDQHSSNGKLLSRRLYVFSALSFLQPWKLIHHQNTLVELSHLQWGRTQAPFTAYTMKPSSFHFRAEFDTVQLIQIQGERCAFIFFRVDSQGSGRETDRHRQ